MASALGVDIGGTFTDLVHVDAATGVVTIDKVPSEHGQLESSVRSGLETLQARYDLDPADLSTVVHGTTVATNAVLEHTLPRTVLVVTRGFADVLEIGTMMRPGTYDLRATRPAALVDRSCVIELDERVAADGTVVLAPSAEALAAVADAVALLAPEAVAVSLLFGHRNPTHERLVADAVAARLPGVPVSLGSDVDPQTGEYPRANTTALNASLRPLVIDYVARFGEVLVAAGTEADLLVMQSNGGLIPPSEVGRNAHRLVLSGPAGGVVAAQRVLPAALGGHSITFDVGGTSSDLCLIADGRASVQLAPAATDPSPVRASALNIHTVGAGGGSIASVDAAGLLTVGPRSAGSYPGPVCYARGGTEPTVTDAQVVLGRLPGALLGGEMKLDVDSAREALERVVAGPLGTTVEDAAEAVLAIAVASMERGLRVVSVDAGYDPRDFSLVAYGGQGPLQAADLAAAVGMSRVVVPPASSAFSALGMLCADLRQDLSVALGAVTSTLAESAFSAAVDQLAARAAGSAVAVADDSSGELVHAWWADLRYVGQSGSLRVRLPEALVAATGFEAGLAGLVAAFHAEHHRSFGHSSEHDPVELAVLRLEVSRRRPEPRLRMPDAVDAAPVTERLVHFPGPGWVQARVVPRSQVQVDAWVAGPAVVEDRESTTVVPPGARVTAVPPGCLVIELSQGESR